VRAAFRGPGSAALSRVKSGGRPGPYTHPLDRRQGNVESSVRSGMSIAACGRRRGKLRRSDMNARSMHYAALDGAFLVPATGRAVWSRTRS
jgi:hypothetical protein